MIAALGLVLLCLLPAAALAAEPAVVTTQYLSGAGALSDETPLGDAAADAMLAATGADIAILGGGDVADRELPGGAQTEETLKNAVADREIVTTELTPKEIFAILEAGASHIQLDEETKTILREESAFWGFPQIGGFSLQYDAAGHPGERVMRVTLTDGTVLDREDESLALTLAATEPLLSGEEGFPVIDGLAHTGRTLADALADYAAAGLGTNYTREHRLSVAGSSDDTIIEHIPYGVLIALVVLFAAVSGVKRIRTAKEDWDHDNDPDWGQY